MMGYNDHTPPTTNSAEATYNQPPMNYEDLGLTDDEQADNHYDAQYDIETDEYWTFAGDEDEHHEAAIEHNPHVDSEVF